MAAVAPGRPTWPPAMPATRSRSRIIVHATGSQHCTNPLARRVCSSGGRRASDGSPMAGQLYPFCQNTTGRYLPAAKGGAVAGCVDAGDRLEQRAEVSRVGETHVTGNASHIQVSGLQKFLGVPDAHAVDPLHRAVPDLCMEPTIEGAHTHVGRFGDVGKGEVAVGVLFDPLLNKSDRR